MDFLIYLRKVLGVNWRTNAAGWFLILTGLYDLYYKKELNINNQAMFMAGWGFLRSSDSSVVVEKSEVEKKIEKL